MIGNISNIWVKPRVQTRNTLTHWRTTHEAQGCSKTKMVFLLFLYWFHINSSWPVAESYTHTTQIYTCPLHFKTNTKLLWLHPWSLSARSRKGPDCKTVRTTSFLFSKPPTFLQSVSIFFWNWNSLQKPAKLHCRVTLTSIIKWQTGYNLTSL